MRLLKGSSTKLIVLLKRGTCRGSLDNKSIHVLDSSYASINSLKLMRSSRWSQSIFGQRKAEKLL